MTRQVYKMAMVVALAGVGLAYAQEEETRYEPEPTTKEVMSTAQLEGGVNFYSGGMAGLTVVGPAWGVRMGAHAGLLGGEIAYRGAYNIIADDVGLGEDAGSIWKNGVSALAKVGPTFDERLTPYLGAGIGTSFLHPTQNATPAFRDDVVFEIPLAVGVDYRAKHFNAGLRGSWTPLVGLEVADGGPFSDTNGGAFLTTLNLGGVF
ncbi:MAG: hypothetical protein ACOZIN_16970 [Myxococcota bacterium]